jgi:hypothetical protein
MISPGLQGSWMGLILEGVVVAAIEKCANEHEVQWIRE